MAYMRCNACGIVFDAEISLMTSCMNKRCPQQSAGESQFTLIGQTASEWGSTTSDASTRLTLNSRQMAGILITKQRTVVSGVARIDYKGKKKGEKVYKTPYLSNRDLIRVLQRIRDGKEMPPDMFGRTHKHWGATWRNEPTVLPVTGYSDYYIEFGVDITIGDNPRPYFTGERIVVGRCSEFYYTCDHYRPGSWWVYNSCNGQWYQFER